MLHACSSLDPFCRARKYFTRRFMLCTILRLVRRGDRVAEGARLESVCTARYRGFESLPLRHLFKNTGSLGFVIFYIFRTLPVSQEMGFIFAVTGDGQVPRNGRSRTPSGPEGSSGSDAAGVPRTNLAVTCGGKCFYTGIFYPCTFPCLLR